MAHGERRLCGISVTELLKRTLRESWEDQVFGQSARLAFYHFMAIFPTLLIVLIPLAHLSAHGSAMRRNLEGSFGEILPNDTLHSSGVRSTISMLTLALEE